MNKLKVKLENCYGIKKLEKDFNFSENNTYAIYAPNGVMKTSFAKTFQDLSQDNISSDLIFPNRETKRSIKKDSQDELSSKEVFVIEPYNQGFLSEKISTLLVNGDLRSKYETIHTKIDIEKNALLKELKELSGLRNDIEREISETFTGSDKKLLTSFDRVEKEVLDESPPNFSEISYKKVFNEKSLKFIETNDFERDIKDYITNYNKLLEDSKYFKKGIFNHNNATTIAKNLVDNGFFKADHTVSLNSNGEKKEIKSKEELEGIIQEEKDKILNNPTLIKAFEAIDKKLKANQDLREFRDYLLSNKNILQELGNIRVFKEKLWISYLKQKKEFYKSFLCEYKEAGNELGKIIKEAKKQETHWRQVVNIFNKRFSVPFKLIVENQDDVILKREVPNISFMFVEQEEEKRVKQDDLLKALSSGEKKALYILNIIFEVEARRKNNHDTLFIVDDIADSFDYKNKYAIVEYLRDISRERKFYQIILSHNFDFFRTVQSRFVVPYKNCLFVEKEKNETKIKNASYINNPFKNDWIRNLNDDRKLIASIPFIRNIIEYTDGSEDEDYLKMSSILHFKDGSDDIKKSFLENIFRKKFPILDSLSLDDKNKGVLELIFELADKCLDSTESINLENKIVLSIAIRLRAEKIMLEKLDNTETNSTNQTGKLLESFKIKFCDDPSSLETIKLLEQVTLMTPENIHLNSFMYEPIIDMSDEHLKNLYKNITKMS